MDPSTAFGQLGTSFCCFGLVFVCFGVLFVFFLNILILWGISNLMKLDKKDFSTAAYAILAIIAASIIVNMIQLPLKLIMKHWALNLLATLLFLGIQFAIAVIIIQKAYGCTMQKALLTYFLTFIATIIVYAIIALILGAAFIATIGATFQSMMNSIPV